MNHPVRPVDISYRHMPRSEPLERFVTAWAARLERLSPRLQRLAVVVEAPHRRRRQGNLFHVRVRLTLPGGELVSSRDAEQDHAHEDVHVAARDAFRAARRELMEHARRRRRGGTVTACFRSISQNSTA